MNTVEFTPEPFQPHPLMRNPHVQTLAGEYFRPKSGVDFRRVRLDTPDADFLDLDFVDVPNYRWAQLGDHAPILYFLHGLEGDARGGNALDLYKIAAPMGFRCVGLNYRACSGEMNRTPRLYHMGATDDVAFVHQWLLAQYPDVPMVMVGISLGGNMLLKYFGECGDALPERVRAGAAISPPFVSTGYQRLSDAPVGKLYGGYLLRRLQQKVRQKQALLRGASIDVAAALRAKTLREYDNAVTAPLFGFKDAEDYYNQCNSVRFLSAIRRPTLLLRAKDDPFFDAHNIPHDLIAQNPHLYPAFPDYGGHVGFIEGTSPRNYRSWAQRQAARFFEAILKASA